MHNANFRPLPWDFSPTIDSMHWRSEPFLKVERDQQNTMLGSPEVKIAHSSTVKGASVTCQSNTTASTSRAAMNIQFSRRSFHLMFRVVSGPLYWQCALILCKPPFCTFSPLSWMPNFKHLNHVSCDCGLIRRPKQITMNGSASLVCLVNLCRVAWLPTH